jgi:hypothetical protein
VLFDEDFSVRRGRGEQIGGGIGLFHWFHSRKALLDHLAEHLTYESPGRSGTDPFVVHAAVKQAIEKFRGSDELLESLIPKLNPAAHIFSDHVDRNSTRSSRGQWAV